MTEDFYVDDVLSGAGTCDEAIEKQTQLIEMLNRGGFHIHKWCSNMPDLLRNIPAEDCEKTMLFENSDANETIKTLGILWNPVADEFVFRVNRNLESGRITKRVVLSGLAKLFDPLGLVGPVIVSAKIFMQNLWKAKLLWDEQLPVDLASWWQQFCAKLPLIENIKISRFVLADDGERIELHGFADASLKAYGACVYVCQWKLGRPHMKLLCSKSKVAPFSATAPEELKIPRLELNAALLLSNLVDKVKKSIRIDCVVFFKNSVVVS